MNDHPSRHDSIRAVLWRAALFFLFASALPALLPLVARDQARGGPYAYGLLLASIGVGAIAGSRSVAIEIGQHVALFGHDRRVSCKWARNACVRSVGRAPSTARELPQRRTRLATSCVVRL